MKIILFITTCIALSVTVHAQVPDKDAVPADQAKVVNPRAPQTASTGCSA